MPLQATTLRDYIRTGNQTVADLNASCQALLTTSIAQTNSPWYAPLAQALQVAQNLASQWLSYSDNTPTVESLIERYGGLFHDMAPGINALFTKAIAGTDPVSTSLQNDLATLSIATQDLAQAVDHYQQDLKQWGQQLAQVRQYMQDTISAVQAQATDLQAQIKSINTAIDTMQNQIADDRKAISQAAAQASGDRRAAIVGVVLAPFTGGLSLIQSGVGVASAAGAETYVAVMQQTIQVFQNSIVNAQQGLNWDQAQLVTLNGLTTSVHMALQDIDTILQSLDSFRTDWAAYGQELNDITDKIGQAESPIELFMQQLWFETAHKEWESIFNEIK